MPGQGWAGLEARGAFAGWKPALRWGELGGGGNSGDLCGLEAHEPFAGWKHAPRWGNRGSGVGLQTRSPYWLALPAAAEGLDEGGGGEGAGEVDGEGAAFAS